MNALYTLLVVLALAFAALGAGQFAPGRAALTLVVPYAAFTIFLLGFSARVMRWAWVPVPFHIPTTCGQQRSLPWIKTARIDNPSTRGGVFARMAAEVLLFRSLFRNDRARMEGQRLILGESKYLWLGALAFHWALLVILLRHLRLLIEPVPAWVDGLERLDGFFHVGTPQIYLSDVVLLAALAYLLYRRFREPAVRYISLFADYFALYLLLAIAVSGMLMRYFVRVDVLSVKQFALSLAAFRPVDLSALSPLFLTHLLLVCTLGAYLPFSKLMHMGGIFLSPTRNLANDSRRRRHINPWNYPVKKHTYAEWEEEFRDKIVAAGIPIEAEDAGKAHTD
ncbi:MAG: sulfate reduction electron transfer complex DsrMKJOP subunit DsrM [Acidobacteriota bacterium]